MATNDRNAFYQDQTGYQFDLEPVNYMHKQRGESGGIRSHFYGGKYVSIGTGDGYKGWSNWMDKFQPDVRFLAVSDSNAWTYQFPEVEAPWKFTEYTFKGTGEGTTVIEPPLYSPKTLAQVNTTPELQMTGTDQGFYEPLYWYQSKASGKRYKQEQLEKGIGKKEDPNYLNRYAWYEPNPTPGKEHLCRRWKRKEQYGSRFVFKYPDKNDGVRLSKVKLPAQSVKMGNHGNIPPHTLNMSAPEEYFKPESIYLTKVVPRLVATSGSPVFAKADGIIEYDQTTVRKGIYSIFIQSVTQYNKIQTYNPEDAIPVADAWFCVTNPSTEPIEQPRPYIDVNNVDKIRIAATEFVTDDLVHRGCTFFQGTKGSCGCALQLQYPEETKPNPDNCIFYPDTAVEVLDTETGEVKSSVDIQAAYEEHATAEQVCPYYQPTGEKEIALYETTASTMAEQTKMIAGAAIDGRYDSTDMVDGKGALSMTGSSMGGGALDYGMASMGALAATKTTIDESRSMGDTDIRWRTTYELETVQSEGREVESEQWGAFASARDTIKRGTGRFAIDEFDTGYGGVDVDFFGDRNMMSIARFMNNVMPCYNPAKCNKMYGPNMQDGFIDGTFSGAEEEEYCRYYNRGCPFNTVPRRAFEYAKNYEKLVNEFAIPFKNSGLAALPGLTYQKKEDEGEGYSHYEVVGPSGQYKDTYPIEGYPEVGKSLYFYFETDVDPDVYSNYYENAKVYAHIKHQDADGELLVLPSGVQKPSGYPSEVSWLVELHEDYVLPQNFVTQIDNESNFFGGRCPEYKDLTKWGEEILTTRGMGGNIYGVEGGSDMLGGDPNQKYQAEQDKGYLMGYWIDEDGEWIVDGRGLGGDVLPGGDHRIGKPAPKKENGATPIAGAAYNTTVSPDITLQAQCARAWVYSSDTRAKLGSQTMQDLTNTEGKPCPPNMPPVGNLPTERTYYECESCNVDAIITDFEYESGITTCPACGGALSDAKSWTSFPDVYARGEVTVWGLPGQAVNLDGYYWRHMTLINRAFVTQILDKLGPPSESGGGFTMRKTGSANAQSETSIGGYPIIHGRKMRDGLPEDEVFEDSKYYELSTDDEDDAIDGTEQLFAHRDTSEDNPVYKDVLGDRGMTSDRLDGGTYRDDILSPYDEDIPGLDMLSLNHLKNLRNQFMPVVGYKLGDSSAKDYYTRKQLDYIKRFGKEDTREWFGKPGTLKPQVVAASSLGRDQMTQFWDGTLIPGGYIFWYWPSGTTWWRLHNKIGGIARHGGTNKWHLDNSADVGQTLSGIRLWYTGNIIKAKSYHFLHGEIPLDKEIVKAYATTRPVDEPSCPPIGRTWIGFEMLEHYHPFRMGHEGIGAHRDFTKVSDEMAPKEAEELEMQAEIGDVGNDYFRPLVYDMESAYHGENAENISQCVDRSYGRSAPAEWSGYLSWAGVGENLIQNFTEEQIWKNYTFDGFQSVIDQDKMDIVYSAGDINNGGVAQTFSMFSIRQLDSIFNQETQSIPSYFDLSGMNDKLYYPKTGPVFEEKVTDEEWSDGGQVIVQDLITPAREYLGQEREWSDGGHGNANAGWRPRTIDITKLVQERYNARVDRAYKISAGYNYGQLHGINQSRRDWASRADSLYPPDFLWNFRVFSGSHGYWMNDPWHYPTLVNDELPFAEDGDELALSPSGVIPDDMISSFYVDPDVENQSDPEYFNYHPWVLCQAYPTQPQEDNNPPARPHTRGDWSYVEGSLTWTPVNEDNDPNDSKLRYWYVSTDNPQDQYFAVDLRPLPIQSSHKPYRLEKGKWNVADAICPNSPSCKIAKNNQTVSEFIAYTKAKPGVTSPSLHGIKCAWCGTSLLPYKNAQGQLVQTGAAYHGGDGIDTYVYEATPDNEVFVAGVRVNQIGAQKDIPDTTLFTDFSVEYKNENSDNWYTLFSVRWLPGEGVFGKWRIPVYLATGTLSHEDVDALPDAFTGHWVDGDFEDNVDGRIAGHHFRAVKARYLRYKCTPKKATTYAPSALGGLSSEITVTDTVGTLSTTKLDDALWQGGTLEFSNDFDIGTIDSSTPIASNTPSKVSCTKTFDSSPTKFRLKKPLYNSNCAQFEVYGFETRPGDVYMTDRARVMKLPLNLSTGNMSIVMYENPTKIISVKTGSLDTVSMELSEAERYNSNDFYWTVETRTDKNSGAKYQHIIAGKYYFAPETRSITMPGYCKNLSTKKVYKLIELNSNFRQIDVPQNIIPNFMEIEYFTHIGTPVTLPINAIGSGPSYQVERESVCYIAGSEPPDEETPTLVKETVKLSGGSIESSLPSMGKSVKLKSDKSNLNKENLYWQAYNHKPMYGEFGMDYIRGDEMPAGGWNESDISKLFGGDDQTYAGLSGGGDTHISGKVGGEVTLYGIPDAIISGDIYVYAKALTERKYKVGEEEIKTYERTGGLKYTGFCLGAEVLPDDTGAEKSRKGMCFEVPTIKVYATERDNTTRPKMK